LSSTSKRVKKGQQNVRLALVAAVLQAGRDYGDATVLFHIQMAAQLGLNPTDYKTMSLLSRVERVGASDIARHTGLSSASVTELLDRLERKGFIRRIHDSVDRRRILVEANAEKVEVIAKLFGSAQRTLNQILDLYNNEQLAAIADFLKRNSDRLQMELERSSEA
jgi:DNA-binding MarR family transcriptional regulator